MELKLAANCFAEHVPLSMFSWTKRRKFTLVSVNWGVINSKVLSFVLLFFPRSESFPSIPEPSWFPWVEFVFLHSTHSLTLLPYITFDRFFICWPLNSYSNRIVLVSCFLVHHIQRIGLYDRCAAVFMLECLLLDILSSILIICFDIVVCLPWCMRGASSQYFIFFWPSSLCSHVWQIF